MGNEIGSDLVKDAILRSVGDDTAQPDVTPGPAIGGKSVVDLAKTDGLFQAIEEVKNLVDDGDFHLEGVLWWVVLDDRQTKTLQDALNRLSHSRLAMLAGPVWDETIKPVLGQLVDYIQWVNRLGGENGVEITSVLGARGAVVTPRFNGIFNQLIRAARIEASGMAILEWVVYASGQIQVLGNAMGLPVVATIFNAVASGSPLGWAIAGAVGLAVKLFQPEPDPNAHGAVMANRTEAREWESFYLATIGEGNRVSLLSWQGFFSAQGGGGHGVYANRPRIGDWEKWTLIRNDDGTVSLQTFDGHYLCAEMGGGRECQANRTSIGNWEKFYLVNLPNGQVALKTHDRGLFVSVQQNS